MEPKDKLQDLVRRFARAEKHRPLSTPQPTKTFPGKPHRRPGLLAWLDRPTIVPRGRTVAAVILAATLIATELLDAAIHDDMETRYQALYQETVTLRRELATLRKTRADVPELPPPYEDVRSGFANWHICTTGDCVDHGSTRL
ncbi:MAG TPA: hypothetical protein ENK05_08750 [Gammaproteobacteria bacterium]|nr:hypothetical protein [Gammaproteobacteria bacterium]